MRKLIKKTAKSMPSPTKIIIGRRTARTAFPVEILWPSLTPRMARIRK
jgi:hypothetical protein